MHPDLIAWDFDGGLNHNFIDGRFIWADTLREDFGLEASSFQSYVFRSERVDAVMTGQVDLYDVVAGWLYEENSPVKSADFIDYWFSSDEYPDEEVLGWIKTTKARSVMATNNEAYRTKHIAEVMGYSQHMEHIFASGHLGVAKPNSAFYEAIESWSGLSGSKILLVDDRLENIEAASARGWQAFYFTSETRSALPQVLGL